MTIKRNIQKQIIPNTKVAITKCESYHSQELYTAITLVAQKAEMPNINGKTILLKPNILSDAKPEDCITTNPEFVRTTIKYLKDCGAKEIYVGDSPGLQSSSFEGKRCGIKGVCDDEGAIWVDFTKNPITKKIKGTGRTLPIANIIDKVDMVFSLSKFKTHQLMYTTGAVKNLFGTIPGMHKSTCHIKCPSRESFAKLIVGIYETIKPSFSLMDAVIGMEGSGPANGTPRTINLVMGSCNGIALDYAQAIIMGYDPKQIPIINEAFRRHIMPNEIVYPILDANSLIIANFNRIPLREKTQFIKTLILPFFTRGIQKRLQKKEPGPVFNNDKCICCLKCVNVCPAKALQISNSQDKSKERQHIVIDYNKCIRCYCCHEMCPVNAISVEGKN